MSKAIWRRFGVRVTAAMILSMLAVVLLSGIMIYQTTFKAQFEDLRTRLKAIAQTAAMTVDPGYLTQIPLRKEGINTPAYSIISDQLRKIKAANAQIKFIYILTKTDNSSIWKFVVDLDSPGSSRGKHPEITAYPGMPYDAGRFQEMLNGYDRPSADQKLEVDEWGSTLSGYAPIRDALGKPMAVLGVDVDAQEIYAMERAVIIKTLIVLAAGILMALVIGLLIAHRVVNPVQQLITGARYIGQGNLHHRVHVPGDDEISELADAFNEMANNLGASQKKLMNYFFDTVQSLVTVLEIRDHYTLGHSEAVATYSGQIAAQMGIDPKTREMFYKICLLHDIGKVGVRDQVLHKPEKLTEEEWALVKMHPAWGERILKPILEDPLMMAVIRNHHERHDGRGYPDGWAGEQIPLLVSIITVADSYDAMTTTRAYRRAMSQEQAVEQLIKNRGTQFHPDVVDAFLKILSAEKHP